MPKKQQRNAFFFFMKELEPQLRREGRVFPNGMADVVPLAHPRWKDLSAKEKERFENMSKQFKAKMRGCEGDKYRMDTKGQFIANRRDETQDLMNYFNRMAKDVKASWPPGKEVVNESFFLVNVQTLCVTEEGDFLPCEIALLEFSLKNGIIKTFHKFIEPGRIPIGYKYTCMSNSERTHQIPCEHFELADADYSWMWAQMKNFVNPNKEKEVYPPVYCRPSVYKETKYCLEWLHRMALDRGTCQLGKVLNLEGLLIDLYAHLGQPIIITVAIDILASNTYDFVPKHLCKFHEEKECKHCSLGIIRRYAYSIFDELVDFCDYELTPNHLPPRCENTVPVTLILPQKTSIFNKPPVNRGPPSDNELSYQGWSQIQKKGAVFASRDYRYANKSDSEDNEEEEKEPEDYTPLRLPKTSALSNVVRNQGSAWSQGQPLPMGRGMAPIGTDFSQRTATGVLNPAVFQPPFSAQPIQIPSSAIPGQSVFRPGYLGQGVGLAIGRGMPVGVRQPMPRCAMPPSPGGTGHTTLAARGCGRGVLGPLPAQSGLPVGRGFAPPSLMGNLGRGVGGMCISNSGKS